jgi:hypothetical protein
LSPRFLFGTTPFRQYRAVQETVMVSPGAVVARRMPAQYQTVMVPQTVMVAPAGVAYE